MSSAARVHIRPARPDEGKLLRDIPIASKAVWGYDLEDVHDWAASGDFTAEGLAAEAGTWQRWTAASSAGQR